MNTVTRLFDFRKKQEPPRSKAKVAAAAVEQPSDAARADVAALMAKIARENSDIPARSRQSTNASPRGKLDRRHRRRVKISAPVRIRQSDAFLVNEFDLTMTIDVSREGVMFESSRQSYTRGQEVAVVFPYVPASWDPVKEQRGQVVRVARASEKRFSIAVAFLE
ncbi:MAG: PilZ domain-containing protein, partial [Candidatus Acidiferrales bacterium]